MRWRKITRWRNVCGLNKPNMMPPGEKDETKVCLGCISAVSRLYPGEKDETKV